MKSSITSSQVTKVLDALYADAAQSDPLAHQAVKDSGATRQDEAAFYKAMTKAYLPVNREFGNLLYCLVRSIRAQTVVEFGTSFGISTIFLAAALRDNGVGKVITTEFAPEKVERARKNLSDAGLEEWVEFRIGDALQTLSPPPPNIDLAFLDGAKGLYLPVLKLLEPQIRSGGLVASDNTDHDGMEAFLAYIRNPNHGYLSSPLVTGEKNRGHEITSRL